MRTCLHTSMFLFSIDSVAIMVVMQLPPRLSRRTEVIMEFLYGMCDRFLSAREMITCKENSQSYLLRTEDSHLEYNNPQQTTTG